MPSIKPILILAFVICSSIGCQTFGPVASSPRAFETEDAFRSWFAFYYQSPHPEELTSAMTYMDGHRYFEDFPDISSIFISQVMKANPESLVPWTTEWQTLGPKAWNVIVISLWLTDTEASRKLAEVGVKHVDSFTRDRVVGMLARSPKDLSLLSLPVRSARHINMIWAAYSATGDARYVAKVIDVVAQFGDQRDPKASQLGEVALSSLAVNALQHHLVAKLCAEANASHPDPRTRYILNAMLTALAKATKDKDRELSH